MDFIELARNIFHFPSNFFIECFDNYELINTLSQDKRNILKMFLAIGLWISITGYLLFCINDNTDIGPKFSINFKKINDNFFEYLSIAIVLTILFLSLNCLIKLFVIVMGMYVFYCSIGNRDCLKQIFSQKNQTRN